MGSVEHVGGGGEIRLRRDKRFPAKTGSPAVGAFTLEGVKEFALEAEVAGVAPTETMWFHYMSDYGDTKVEYMYFPTEGHIDYRPAQPPLDDDKRYTYNHIMLVFVFAMISGLMMGWVIFGG